MSDTVFSELDDLATTGDADAVFDRLVETLLGQKAYHKLFDALLIRRKHSLGLPLSRPTSFDDVPQEHRTEIEEAYVSAAREAGKLFLADGDIASAWMYLRVIQEPEKVAEAIEALTVSDEFDEQQEQILQIALNEQVNPVKGVQMMLQAHGICSTITSLDQAMANLSSEQRQGCAKVMVRELYRDLTENVRRQVQERMPMTDSKASLSELLADCDWLFEGGNYHIDVSHLSSVVRFARSIEPPAEELEMVVQLCDYGSRLDAQLQYPGDPPFEDFYPAHQQLFHVVLGDGVESALDYFRRKLADAPNEQDKPMTAYVLVDLLMRAKHLDEAVDVAADHLTDLGPDAGFSFAELCTEAGRLDRLAEVAREQGDLVGYAAALVALPASATTST